jgi:hypothetical protein
MKLPFLLRNRHRRTRGQAMVEFAMLLPVLALLMVMSLDLGRVFFGWVGLQNVSRVAANYAAVNPEGWDPTFTNAEVKQQTLDQYAEHVAREAATLNCSPLPVASPTATYIPLPSFDDMNGNGKYDLGERVSVTLGCSFQLMTPLANSAVGGGVGLTANSVFPVRGGNISGGPVPVPSASASASASASGSASASASASASGTASASASPCGLPIANFVYFPSSGKKPLDVYFQDTSQTFGCAITGWQWDFDYVGGVFTVDSTVANPSHKYVFAGIYEVMLKVTAPGGTATSETNVNYVQVCNVPC